MAVVETDVRATLEGVIDKTGEHGQVYEVIGDLAQATLRLDEKCETRFDRIDLRFAQIDLRFAEIDARFDQVDARFAQVDARFDRMDARLDRMDIRLGLLEDTSRKTMAYVERLVGFIIKDELG